MASDSPGLSCPVGGFAHVAHGVGVFGIAERIGSGHESGVEGAPGPDAAVDGGEVLLGLGELPVGDLADCGGYGGWFDGGGQIFGERAGVVGIGAEVAGGVLGDAVQACGFGVGRGGGGVGGGGGRRRAAGLGRVEQLRRRDRRSRLWRAHPVSGQTLHYLAFEAVIDDGRTRGISVGFGRRMIAEWVDDS